MGAKLAGISVPLQLAAYRALAGLVNALPLRGRIGQSLAARRSALQRWAGGPWKGPRPQPVIWFHVASVGEALAAEPIIRRIRTALPGAGIALTWSSPSVAEFPHHFGADIVDAAPPETRRGAAAVCSAIRPDLLVFSRSDLWPEMLLAARERGTPVAVVGGSLRPGSARLRSPVVHFYRSLMEPVRFVGAVSDDHARRWVTLGVKESAVRVTGDPRHDQVLERVTSVTGLRPLLRWSASGPTLVAGSVEPEDETVVLEALAAVRQRHRESRLLIVPHDPGSEVIARLLRHSEKLGLPAEVMEDRDSASPVVIVARRGMLADAYVLGSVSYVGGGFGHRGLHAVIEPAAYAVPVIHGPRFTGSDPRGISLPRQAPGRALAEQWSTWIENDEDRLRAGMAARNRLSQGAAAISARSLLSLLG